MIRIQPLASASDLRFIVARLREADAEEIFACRWDKDREAFADELLSFGPQAMHFLAYGAEGEPIASFGAVLLWEGVATVWAFGTHRFLEVAPTVTRFIRRAMIPALITQGVHRAECRALASRTATARWLRFLGARCEAVIPGFGNQKQDFVLYAWTRLDDDVGTRTPQSPSQA
jgi:hypothetical protein